MLSKLQDKCARRISSYLSYTQILSHHIKPWPTSLAPSLRSHHLQNCSPCFQIPPWTLSTLDWLVFENKISAILCDYTFHAATTSSLRFLAQRNSRMREPSVCLHQSYGIAFQIPSRMLQAWTPSKLNWNHIYIYINLSFSILHCSVLLFWYLFSYLFICVSGLYFALCILRRRRFINADIVLILYSWRRATNRWKEKIKVWNFWEQPLYEIWV